MAANNSPFWTKHLIFFFLAVLLSIVVIVVISGNVNEPTEYCCNYFNATSNATITDMRCAVLNNMINEIISNDSIGFNGRFAFFVLSIVAVTIFMGLETRKLRCCVWRPGTWILTGSILLLFLAGFSTALVAFAFPQWDFTSLRKCGNGIGTAVATVKLVAISWIAVLFVYTWYMLGYMPLITQEKQPRFGPPPNHQDVHLHTDEMDEAEDVLVDRSKHGTQFFSNS